MTNGRKPILFQLPTTPAVEAYLQNKGWTKVTPTDPNKANPNVLVYRGGSDVEGNPLTVILPARPDLIDAKRRVSDVVRFLAALEAKSPRHMVQEIIVRERPSTAVAPKNTSLRSAARGGQTSPLTTKNRDKATKITA